MNNPYPTGLGFGGAAAERIKVKLAEMAAENARRVPCALCGLHILPEDMPRHVAICHGDEG
jgi:hypothetical protein